MPTLTDADLANYRRLADEWAGRDTMWEGADELLDAVPGLLAEIAALKRRVGYLECVKNCMGYEWDNFTNEECYKLDPDESEDAT